MFIPESYNLNFTVRFCPQNKIVSARLTRERERLTKEFENSLKRCMAAVHLNLYQEMISLKRESDAETQDPLRSDLQNNFNRQPTVPVSESKNPADKSHKGGGNI